MHTKTQWLRCKATGWWRNRWSTDQTAFTHWLDVF